MNPGQITAGPRAGAAQNADAWTSVFEALLATREARRLLNAAVSQLLKNWAGKAGWKQFVSKLAERVITSPATRPDDQDQSSDLRLLLEDENFIRNLAELLSSQGRGQAGAFLTTWARIYNKTHNEDPEFLIKALEPGIRPCFEAADFGELKEAADNLSTDALALVETANEALWDHPAKMILILSFLPALVNLTAKTLEISLKKLNDVPPDLLADIAISLFEEIDGPALAHTLDELAEIDRKIHTGSALLGEPGAPRLPKVLSTKIKEIVEQIDQTALWKARLSLAETRADFDQALFEALNENPDLFALNLVKGWELKNIRHRTRNQQLSFWENLDDEELGESLSRGQAAYDVQEAAEVVNNLLRILNRLGDQKPEVEADLVRGFLTALDSDELAEAARRIFSGPGEEVRPLARVVAPGLVELVCNALAPEDDEFEEDAARARQALRSLFMAEET